MSNQNDYSHMCKKVYFYLNCFIFLSVYCAITYCHTLPIWILCIDFIFTVADELPNLVLYGIQFTEGINFDYVIFKRVACQTCPRKKLIINMFLKFLTNTISESWNSALIRSDLSPCVISSYLNE